MRRIVLCLFCITLVVFSFACTNSRSREGYGRGDSVSGGNAEERACAQVALLELPLVIYNAVGTVRITNDCRGFVSRFVVGYAHRGGPLCIREGRVGRAVIWHEAAHAHFHTLPREAQEQWENFFDENLFHDQGINIAIHGLYPSHGIITSYGGSNSGENYAEWVTWLMHYLRGYGTSYGRVDLSCVDKSDKVYLFILKFFHDAQILTDDEFSRVQALFVQ